MKDPSAWVYKSEGTDGKPYEKGKHEVERYTQGFSTYDWWGFDSYLSFVIIGGLKKFIADGNGYPGTLESKDEWDAILETMIEGFEASETLKDLSILDYGTEEYEHHQRQLGAVRDEGFALFTKWYSHLWD